MFLLLLLNDARVEWIHSSAMSPASVHSSTRDNNLVNVLSPSCSVLDPPCERCGYILAVDRGRRDEARPYSRGGGEGGEGGEGEDMFWYIYCTLLPLVCTSDVVAGCSSS